VASEKEGISAHYDAVADDYHRQYQRENLTTLAKYPANYFRLQILATRLAELRARRLYEVGVGEGTPLVTLASMGIEVAGCDISEAMVEASRARFAEAGLPVENIQWADIEDSATFGRQLRDGAYDAVIAAGVLPHISNETLFLENVRALLEPNGTAFIEFRNKLFNFFTFNRPTKEFILDDLLADVDPEVKAAVEKDLDARLAMDQPKPRTTVGENGEVPGYDAILSKFHNPFELTDLFNRSGYEVRTIHWYHYHPAPPMLAPELGPAFREAAFKLEHDPSWRGYFLCSAGVVEAVKR
jgi:2-polyprenyl-3-methyl-5-hydroxy-6-metoxy-1,4-benzoquinol methylase